MMTLEIDARDLVAKLGDLAKQTPVASAIALVRRAEAIMAKSKESFVPVDQGALRASGIVGAPEFEAGGIAVALAYGGPSAPYAVAVHENPRAGKTGGVSPSGQRYDTWAQVGGWKYLETPLLEERASILDSLAQDIGQQLGVR